MSFKTGIASRMMKPTLGIVDTYNTESCPTAVHISSGLDVLFHSLESYTAIPWVIHSPHSWHLCEPPIECAVISVLNRYTERMPRPANPILRPAYQGSNPVADIFSFWALEQTVKYLPRVAKNREDTEARRQLLSVSSPTCFSARYMNIHICTGWQPPLPASGSVMQASISAMA